MDAVTVSSANELLLACSRPVLRRGALKGPRKRKLWSDGAHVVDGRGMGRGDPSLGDASAQSH